MAKLATIEAQMLASPDQQVSLTDPDSRSMATSGRGSGVVGYNVQVAVDTEHHLIVAHEVTNSGSDRSQLANMAKQAKAILRAAELAAVADCGYFNSPEIPGMRRSRYHRDIAQAHDVWRESRKAALPREDFVYMPGKDAHLRHCVSHSTHCPRPLRSADTNFPRPAPRAEGHNFDSSNCCRSPIHILARSASSLLAWSALPRAL